MNMTMTLDGTPFAMTERAGVALREGLDGVCAQQPASMREVVSADVEQRLAQHFRSTLSPGRVISERDMRAAFEAAGFGQAAGPGGDDEATDDDFEAPPGGGAESSGGTDSSAKAGTGTHAQGSAGAGAAAQGGPERGSLRRSPDEALLGGICAGLARWIGIDVVFVRLFFVVLFFLLGQLWILPTYVVMWIIVPMGAPSAGPSALAQAPDRGGSGCLKVGLIALVCGLFFLALIAVILLWPLALSVMGALLTNGG